MKTGLYFQDPKYSLRRDFIFDPSLVLYLPLYKLGGASIMDRGTYGHLCTVTGALWTPQGRSFDGTDDYVDCGSNTSLDNLEDFTFLAWINPASDAYAKGVLGVKDTNKTLLARLTPTKVLHSQIAYSTTPASATSNNNAITLDVWQMVTATSKSKVISLYINGLELSYASQTTGDGNRTSDASSNLRIGYDSINVRYYEGKMGMVTLYNRALSPLEIQHNYLATKWRYR